MDTMSTTRPKFGSVDYFADVYRSGSAAEGDVLFCMKGAIGAIIESDHRTDAERVEYVRNALAAEELVAAEMRAER